MSIQIRLEKAAHHCQCVPLAVAGYCFTRSQLLRPLWSDLDVDMKSVEHSVTDKLQDILLAVLSGCRSLAEVNIRLRPESALATAWQRTAIADQSTLSRLLDALQPEQNDQLRAGNVRLLRRHSQLRHHNWQRPVILDIDGTSLLASKRAEGSTKTWISGKKMPMVGTSCALHWRAITKAFSRLRILGVGMASNT
jgi:hypothetical protein